MVNILFKATKYMNVEDMLIARKDGKRKRKRENTEDAQFNARKRTSQFEGRKDDKRTRPPPRRIINFTPLNTLIDQVLMQIGDNSVLKWPQKAEGRPEQVIQG